MFDVFCFPVFKEFWLPPAYVVRREGTVFSLFVSSHLGEGVPGPGPGGGPRSGGVPGLRSGGGGGGSQSQ